MSIVLAEREAELMAVLWEHGPCTVSEVLEHLADELAYTTVLTILRNLKAKGYVRHEEEGRAHRFAAAVKPEAARRSAVRQLVEKLFKGSTGLLLTHLAQSEDLKAEDVRRIRKLLSARPRKAKP